MDESMTHRSPRPLVARAAPLLATLVLALATGTAHADDDAIPVKAEPAAGQGVAFSATALLSQMHYYAIPFGIASIIALWFAIERLVVLRRSRVIPRSFVDRFFSQLRSGQLDAAEALRICDENGSPVANIFAHGVRKWGKPSVEVEQAIIDGGERQVAQLRRNLRVINGVATVTPLLGLLGTVIGMIQAFNEIAANAGDAGKAGLLAGGIAVALLTTAAGLAIAIPSLITYMYLAGKVDALVMEMDHLAQNVVHLISAEGLSSRSPRPRAADIEPPPATKKAKKPVKKRA